MIGITLSPEQIRTAPPEVRHWIEKQMAATLGLLTGAEDRMGHADEVGLAACTLEEAAGIFELIRGDYLVSQVFFELGRESPNDGGAPPLHGRGIAEIMRHTRVGSGERLLAWPNLINRALQQVRGDPAARMFGFDQRGTCYLHEETHRSIARLWQEVVAAASPAPLADQPEPATSAAGWRPVAGRPREAGQAEPPMT